MSDDLSFEELSRYVLLRLLSGWSKGDLQRNGKSNYKFSKLSFGPFKSEAYPLEQQINLLLTELEKDAENVKKLSEKATAYISVCKHQYISGNARVHFDIETISRLSNLNLSIDIDTYIVGNAIKDDGK